MFRNVLQAIETEASLSQIGIRDVVDLWYNEINFDFQACLPESHEINTESGEF